ncbi:MAG: carboxypeptidase-like regulatory domain-containing protein [Planctomycetaceae bacterium]|jgi:hypothetical protein|nr:carboxypeptidase-like regulatory domain-containing protein [Planctomycetaceae bacterium]
MFFLRLKKIALLFLAALLLGGGCSSKPSGFPNVQKTSVRVADGTTPIEGATVILTTESQSDAWGISAFTDASGKASFFTMQNGYSAEGAPAGQYKVVVQKDPDLPSRLSNEEIEKMSPEEEAKYHAKLDREKAAIKSVIPNTLGSVKSTPLTFEVGKDFSELTIDISKYK